MRVSATGFRSASPQARTRRRGFLCDGFSERGRRSSFAYAALIQFALGWLSAISRALPFRAAAPISCHHVPNHPASKSFPRPPELPPRSEPFSRRNRNESWLDSKAILGGGGNFSAPIGMRTEPTRAWNLNSDSRCEYFEMSRQLLAPRAQCCSESICAISSWVRGARGESHKNATLRQRRTALEAPKTSKEDSQRAERR